MKLVNGAQACNVFWQVGSSATLGTTTVFAGNILALTSITMNNGVTLNGRALARNGAVTLIDDTITAPHCARRAVDVSPRAARRCGHRRQPGRAAQRGRRGGARRRRRRPHALDLDALHVDALDVDALHLDALHLDPLHLDGRGDRRRGAVGALDLDVRYLRDRRDRRHADQLRLEQVPLGPELVVEPSRTVSLGRTGWRATLIRQDREADVTGTWAFAQRFGG